jgi:hypothetical protein
MTHHISHFAAQMAQSHPIEAPMDVDLIAACIEACFACSNSCTACADACLAEATVEHLRRCIRINMDCGDICTVTGRILSRQTETDWQLVRIQIEVCRVACQICRVECETHAGMHEHCKICAESCYICEEACARLLAALPGTR